MLTSLPFARFVQLIKAIEQLPVPSELYNRHRMQYDYILGQLCLSSAEGKNMSVADLAGYSILGSQPTANKRLQELISYGLIESKEGEDRRQKMLILTNEGYQYLEACSAAMSKVVNQQAAI
jgi:DNA-binding MarR family transcriptional regulator